MRRVAVLGVGILCACGLAGGNQARCDLRPQTPQCTDWRNSLQPVFTTQEALCKTLGATGTGGTFTSGQACASADMWGGCQARSADGTLQTNWYYKSDAYKAKADAQAECARDMTWVEPG